jgi:hypothetical protein
MKNIDEQALRMRIETVVPTLNEYQRRIYLSVEAKTLGRGGISLVSRISGMSRPTLTSGIKELSDTKAEVLPQGRSRKAGGGRKSIIETQPGILEKLEELVSAHTKGDPMRSLLYTNKSLKNLQKGLNESGYEVSHDTVGELLKKLGYGLQSDKKTLTVKPSHPDRNEQFEYINEEVTKASAAKNPVISIDAKKKEKIGNFKNDGKTYQPHKTPIEVLDHDFPIPELGKATPYGIYDVFKNQGFVNVGLSAETAMFAVESIRRWWYDEGVKDYENAEEIVITADCGGSNGNRNRLWKYELQQLANEIEKPIKVLHYPPGTSKWNKIEHRLFSYISINWQGIPLISVALILSLIGATTTGKGLAVTCVLDEALYEKGRKVSDSEFNSINIFHAKFHGEWNYTIKPYWRHQV